MTVHNKNKHMTLSKPSLHRYKILLPIGFSLIILLMILTSLIAIVQLKQSSEKMVLTAQKHTENYRLLQTMDQAALKRTITLFEILNTDDPFEADELFMHLNELATSFTVAREAFKSKVLDERMRKLFTQQGKIARNTAPKQKKVYDYIQQGEKEKARQLFLEKTLPRSKIFLDVIKDMAEKESLSTRKIFQDAKKHNDQVLFSILIFDIISILASIALTIFIVKKQRSRDQHLAQLANTDLLTQLPNRTSLIQSIDQHIEEKPNTTFAVVFFDIDYFKNINDNYGHEFGDEILKRFARKIRLFIKKEDVLARFGGDEFVLMLRSIYSEDEARKLISIISASLDTSLIIKNQEIFITSSIGVTMYPQDSNKAKALLKNADIAMYSAKQAGRNCFTFYSENTRRKMEQEHTICHALHTILKSNNKQGELRLLYQPLLNIKDNSINECEALIRWTDTKGRIITPDEFIPIAEKSNLIEKINLFVINEACKQQLIWQKQRAQAIRININLSGNKIIFRKLLSQFKQNLTDYQLSPKLFGIELTERTLFDISDDTIEELDQLRKEGVKISIDDFGTGYSSLSYLKKLPITTLKIDKEFICCLPDDKDNHAMVKTIITLAHSLHLDVVAEGVENQAQLDFLQRYACDIAQGYYFHQPLDGDQVTHLKIAA